MRKIWICLDGWCSIKEKLPVNLYTPTEGTNLAKELRQIGTSCFNFAFDLLRQEDIHG